MNKEDHIEVSEGDTKIVSYSKCPLEENEINKKQIFYGEVCCIIRGQGADFVCPGFFGAVYPNKENKLYVDCRYKE